MRKRKLAFSRELVGDNIDDIVADGIEAEQLGFDVVWVPDHLVDLRPVHSITDAWTTLAYIGAKTHKIRLGSGVTDIQRMHPAKTANIVATLDRLTKGRAILGIGAGEIMNTAPFGIPWKEKKIRIRELRECILLMKMLWSSSYESPVNFPGEFYSLSNAHLSLSPYQRPGPPVYIGAFSANEMLRLVGEIGEGWYPGSQNTLEAFKEKVEVIRESAKRSTRSLEEIDLVANIPVLVSENEKEKIELIRKIKRALVPHLILSQHLLKLVGISAKEKNETLDKKLDYQLATPGLAFDESLRAAVEKTAVTDEELQRAMNKLVVIGGVDECLEKIQTFIDAGATQIFFANFCASRKNYGLIGKEIIPRLNQE